MKTIDEKKNLAVIPSHFFSFNSCDCYQQLHLVALIVTAAQRGSCWQ